MHVARQSKLLKGCLSDELLTHTGKSSSFWRRGNSESTFSRYISQLTAQLSERATPSRQFIHVPDKVTSWNFVKWSTWPRSLANIFFLSPYFNNTQRSRRRGLWRINFGSSHFFPPIWQLLNSPAGNKYTHTHAPRATLRAHPLVYLPSWLTDFANIRRKLGIEEQSKQPGGREIRTRRRRIYIPHSTTSLNT